LNQRGLYRETWNRLLQNIQPEESRSAVAPFDWFFSPGLPRWFFISRLVNCVFHPRPLWKVLMGEITSHARQIRDTDYGLIDNMPEEMIGHILQFSDIREGIRVYQLVSRIFRAEVSLLLRLMRFAEDGESRVFLQRWR
jgi:hypothetical protein